MSASPQSPPVEELARQYIAWDRDAVTRGQVEKALAAGDTATMEKLLRKRIGFGTAGLRAVMEGGFSRMNALTVIQTAQGIARHLKASFDQQRLRTTGVVIGYDGRNNSRRFATLMSSVMHLNGVRVLLFSATVPTSFVPYALRRHRCVCGLMITASHNTKEYNGCKVYWEDGVQVSGPHDKRIAAAILQSLEPHPAAWEPYTGDVDPLEETTAAYMAEFARRYAPTTANDAAASVSVPLVYTAMHGVGTPYVQRILPLVGVPAGQLTLVAEQAEPDGNFPTVRAPNPEEGVHTLKLAIATAERCGARVILANDPDADRLAVCERSPGGAWRLFSGNEAGALLGWWAVQRARAAGEDLSKLFFITSFVSSSLLRSMAAREGLGFIPTATGFKWMGAEAARLEASGRGRAALAYEESIGYMWGTQVLDKDGVSAAAVLADMIRHLYVTQGRTLAEQLQDLYRTYGYHISYNSYLTVTKPAAVPLVFRRLQTMNGGTYPASVAGARVVHVRDLSTGLDTAQPDKRATLPISARNPVITLGFDNGISVTLRGSGTEPKLKWYSELVSPTDDQLRQRLEVFVRSFVDEVVRPEEHGLVRRPRDFPSVPKPKL